MQTLFEERHFSWPDLPGNPEREAKLPWFWFTDVGEARTYLQLWWVWQSIAVLLFLNVWLVRNHTLGFVLLACLLASQAAFLRVWIPLCRRATPPVGRWDWFLAGWFNPKSRHCLLTAWDVIRESQGKGAANR
jgi:hypothetical protein